MSRRSITSTATGSLAGQRGGAVPELPEMQALAERLDAALGGTRVAGFELLGFTGLKTVLPSPDELVGAQVTGVGRRGKYLVIALDPGSRILVHLSQAGRIDLEAPAKHTRPRGSVVRICFDDDSAVLLREHGSQRKAGWWILAPGDEGPLATLGPEPSDPAFDRYLLHEDATRHVHTILRDQRTLSGIGRGYADDICNAAGISPFASLRSLTPDQRSRLVAAVHAVLESAVEGERSRTGGLSEAKLGLRFAVHNRAGQPCPHCGETLLRVSYESHEVVYCRHCQTKGRTLADRRLSKLLR